MLDIDIWCVIIRGSHGHQHLAHSSDGAAVYFLRDNALKFAKDLREHGFRASVEKGKVIIPLKNTNIVSIVLPPSQRMKRGE